MYDFEDIKIEFFIKHGFSENVCDCKTFCLAKLSKKFTFMFLYLNVQIHFVHGFCYSFNPKNKMFFFKSMNLSAAYPNLKL